MILHQMQFADLTAARSALPAHGVEDEGHWQWHAHVVAPQRAVLARASYDEAGEMTAPEQLADGYWLLLLLPEMSPEISAHPACRFVSRADGVVVHVAAGVDVATPINEPWPAGFAAPVT